MDEQPGAKDRLTISVRGHDIPVVERNAGTELEENMLVDWTDTTISVGVCGHAFRVTENVGGVCIGCGGLVCAQCTRPESGCALCGRPICGNCSRGVTLDGERRRACPECAGKQRVRKVTGFFGRAAAAVGGQVTYLVATTLRSYTGLPVGSGSRSPAPAGPPAGRGQRPR